MEKSFLVALAVFVLFYVISISFFLVLQKKEITKLKKEQQAITQQLQEASNSLSVFPVVLNNIRSDQVTLEIKIEELSSGVDHLHSMIVKEVLNEKGK